MKTTIHSRRWLTLLGLGVVMTAGVSIASALVGNLWSVTSFTKIDTGRSYTCAIANQRAYCWGLNTVGQLGDASNTQRTRAVPVSTAGVLAGKNVTDISTSTGNGTQVTCAVADGAAYCWGDNASGQLGNNSTVDSNIPVAVSTAGVLAGRTITAVGVGHSHACAVADSLVFCWGANASGQLGQNNTTPSLVPVAVLTTGVLSGKTITDVSGGTAHTCAVGSGAAYCWGVNGSGQVGDNSITTRLAPVAVVATGVLNGKTVTQIESKTIHTCVVASSDGFCWGENGSGELGNNSTVDSRVPVAYNTIGKNITSITAGTSRSCLVATDQTTYCWGLANIGNGTAAAPRVPTINSLAASGIGVSSGFNHSCAIFTTEARCWSTGTNGQLGNGATGAQTSPVLVLADYPGSMPGYRFAINANSLTPNSPMASTNTPVSLMGPTRPFRVRIAVRAIDINGTTSGMAISGNTFALYYAQKTMASCQVQTGYATVTTTTPIRWRTNAGATNGATISATSSDPVISEPLVYQTYRSGTGNFSNSVAAIPAGSAGLWDFSLQQVGGATNTTYCIAIQLSTGVSLGAATTYPEVTSYTPELTIDMVDSLGISVPSPSFSLALAYKATGCQLPSGSFGTSSQRLRIKNSLSGTGWNISLAATGGAAALWERTDLAADYDYNDPAGCTNPGSDGDGEGGQLGVDPTPATFTPDPECGVTGISRGSSANFTQGSINSITVLNASAAASLYCYWDVTGVTVTQQLSPAQEEGMYSLDLTATVVAN